MRFPRFEVNPTGSAAAAGALALLLAAPMTAAGQVQRSVVRVVGDDDEHASVFFAAQDDDERMHAIGGHTLEVMVEDGKVTVRLNGEAVSEDRIVREGGRIIVLDSDGDEIETIDMEPFGDVGHMMKLRVGDHPGRLWITREGDEEPAAEPTVMLGIQLGEPGPALLHHLRVEPGAATMITALYEGLPARKAGLEPYDVITAIDGETPADPRALRAALAEREAGDVVRLSVVQRGKKKQVDVALAAYDRAVLEDAKVIGEADRTIILGPDMLRERMRLPRGGSHLRLEELDELNNLFLDDRNRIFELHRRERGEAEGRDRHEEGGDLDSRLGRLDRRLEGLEHMLDELLEQAERERER